MRILEAITEQDFNESEFRKFKKKCSHFLKTNESELRDGNYLYRGTHKKYEGKKIVRKSPRERQGVGGTKWKTWAYEYFKPSHYPSRKEMVPTRSGVLEGLFATRNVFLVFPVGSSYKLQYVPSVEDFNSFNYYFEPGVDPYQLLYHSVTHFEEKVPDELVKKAKEVLEKWERNTQSKEYEDIKHYTTKIWKVLKKVEKHEEGTEEGVEIIEDGMQRYFKDSKLTKKLPEEEEGVEVNLFAPHGFYYVKEEVIESELF